MSGSVESPPLRPPVREPSLRTFVAIALADPARAAVVEYLASLRATIGGVAWTRPENLHLTLKFLGNVARSRIPQLTECLRTVAAAGAPFTLQVAGVGAFPNLARPRALWVGVRAPGPALASLAIAVDRACVAEGFTAERHPLHPHLTLGRVRERGGKSPHGGPRDGTSSRPACPAGFPFLATDGGREFGSASVTALVFFQSELHPDGARYTPLATLPLGVTASGT